jgi:hypothetical protein
MWNERNAGVGQRTCIRRHGSGPTLCACHQRPQQTCAAAEVYPRLGLLMLFAQFVGWKITTEGDEKFSVQPAVDD